MKPKDLPTKEEFDAFPQKAKDIIKFLVLYIREIEYSKHKSEYELNRIRHGDDYEF